MDIKSKLQTLRNGGPLQTKSDMNSVLVDAMVTNTEGQVEMGYVTGAEQGHKKVVFEMDENKFRGNWGGKLDFILSMLGYSVGLGNVWRFPYLCYRNGGGVFLIPYLLTLCLVGVPFFFLEVNLGQFSSQGTLTCWGFAPIFKGIGIGMVVASAIVSIYYNMIISYSLYYIFASFTSSLPWKDCNNSWNTIFCTLRFPVVNCSSSNVTAYENGTCYHDDRLLGTWNVSVFTNVTHLSRMTPSEEYWRNRVLKMTDGAEDMGMLRWELMGVWALAWILCAVCLIKGVKTTGKIVYFTALFPYFVLLVLFINGLTLEGASSGISYYITPVWHKLATAQVWKDASSQIFYSLGMGWGALHALASYNKFHNNTFRDSMIVAVGSCLTSIFAGFVIFSYVGYMANKMNLDIEHVATGGVGLAFVVYPEAITHLPASPFWSILFFFMLLTLGLDSQFVTVEAILTGICDQFKAIQHRKKFILVGICIVMFLLGIPLLMQGGIYLVQLFDTFASLVGLPVLCLCEGIALSYFYGIGRFYRDIELMLGWRPGMYWKICWMVLGPVITVVVMIATWASYERLHYGNYVYPRWLESIGWLCTIAPVICIGGTMVYKILTVHPGLPVKERLKLLLKPERSWGPFLVEHRKLVTYVDDFVIDPFNENEYYAKYKPDNNELSNISVINVDAETNREKDVAVLNVTSGESHS